MSERPGCFFGLPARILGLQRGRRAIAAAARPSPRPPHPQEQTSVLRGKKAAKACIAVLHARDDVSPAVLDQVTTAVQDLDGTIDALAQRLHDARAWLDQHDPEALRQALVELELSPGDSWTEQQAAQEEAKSLQTTLQHVNHVERGLPVLRARLDATVRALEELETATSRGRVSGADGAAGLLAQTAAQVEKTRRELDAWRATLRELDALED